MKKVFFSKNLIFIREKKKMTQQQIADFVGVKRNSWNNYENEKSVPNLGLFMKIANLFDISTEKLLYADLSKGNLIQKTTDPEDQKKGNLISNPIGNLIAENEEKYTSDVSPGEMIAALKNSLKDKDKIIESKEALISHLNAEIATLKRNLEAAENIYTQLKKPAREKPA